MKITVFKAKRRVLMIIYNSLEHVAKKVISRMNKVLDAYRRTLVRQE